MQYLHIACCFSLLIAACSTPPAADGERADEKNERAELLHGLHGLLKHNPADDELKGVLGEILRVRPSDGSGTDRFRKAIDSGDGFLEVRIPIEGAYNKPAPPKDVYRYHAAANSEIGAQMAALFSGSWGRSQLLRITIREESVAVDRDSDRWQAAKAMTLAKLASHDELYCVVAVKRLVAEVVEYRRSEFDGDIRLLYHGEQFEEDVARFYKAYFLELRRLAE